VANDAEAAEAAGKLGPTQPVTLPLTRPAIGAPTHTATGSPGPGPRPRLAAGGNPFSFHNVRVAGSWGSGTGGGGGEESRAVGARGRGWSGVFARGRGSQRALAAAVAMLPLLRGASVLASLWPSPAMPQGGSLKVKSSSLLPGWLGEERSAGPPHGGAVEPGGRRRELQLPFPSALCTRSGPPLSLREPLALAFPFAFLHCNRQARPG